MTDRLVCPLQSTVFIPPLQCPCRVRDLASPIFATHSSRMSARKRLHTYQGHPSEEDRGMSYLSSDLTARPDLQTALRHYCATQLHSHLTLQISRRIKFQPPHQAVEEELAMEERRAGNSQRGSQRPRHRGHRSEECHRSLRLRRGSGVSRAYS